MLHANHFIYNIETFKHLSFRVKNKKAKQTDVSMQPTGKWIEHNV